MVPAVSLPSMLFGRIRGPPKARFQTRDWALRKPYPLTNSCPSSVSWRNEMPKADDDAELGQAEQPFGHLWVGRLVMGVIAAECSLNTLITVS